MASRMNSSIPFFFIFDFHVMQGASDDNDVLPQAIIYFYPPDEQIKKQKLLECGEIVGVVQYFQHDLFRSMPKMLYYQKTLVAHEHYGRDSGFLSAPHDRYTQDEVHIHLKTILNIFHMLYGTWNHVHSVYEKDNKMNEFLNQALTPIINFVWNQPQSIPYLFSTVEYTSLKKGNQRVLLECKHYLDYLKSKYGIKFGLLGYDKKILYSSCDPDTSFHLQFLFQLSKDLPEDLVYIPWESEFKLKNGVSLFRIYIRQPTRSIPIPNTPDSPSLPETKLPIITPSKKPTLPINIFDGLSSADDDSSSIKNRFSNSTLSPLFTDKKRLGLMVLTDPSGSSEETGFETDTMDDSPSLSMIDPMSTSSLSISEVSNEGDTENPLEQSLTDEQKLEHLRSRSSTMSNEMEMTIKIERFNNPTEPFDQIIITPVDPPFESSENENLDEFQVLHRTSADRTATVTSNDLLLNKSELHKSDRHEIHVSWTNIPDKNDEHERDELVLYVQRNSRMLFAGVMEQSLLSDEYLKKLWTLMLTQMANMETDIQVTSTSNEIIKLSADVKFLFNESTRCADFERVFDGSRVYRKVPSEESACMALFARMELNRNTERKVIGLSRGNHLISVDRRLPDRTVYSCRRFQENL